jgi:hypothetical protein
MFDTLSKNIVCSIILDYCEDVKDIISIISCNKSTRTLLKDENLWKKITLKYHNEEDFVYNEDITWYDLFVILDKNYRFKGTRATLYEIDKTIMDSWFEERNDHTIKLIFVLVKHYYDTEKINKLAISTFINNYLRENAKKGYMNKIKRGDILHFNKICENDKDVDLGAYIYDGNEIQPLNNINCENTIPNGYYVIDDFPIRYWADIKFISNIIRINNKYNAEIIKNMKEHHYEDEYKYEYEDEDDGNPPYYESSFIHNYETYYVIIEFDDDWPKFINEAAINNILNSYGHCHSPLICSYSDIREENTIYFLGDHFDCYNNSKCSCKTKIDYIYKNDETSEIELEDNNDEEDEDNEDDEDDEDDNEEDDNEEDI